MLNQYCVVHLSKVLHSYYCNRVRNQKVTSLRKLIFGFITKAPNIVLWLSLRILSSTRLVYLSGKYRGHTLPQIPLPGLLLAVKGENGLVDEVRLFALKDRGRPTGTTSLFVAPLPNTSANGEICWGSASIKSCRIEAWELILAEFFGSRFTAHSCSDSCRSHPEDVRQLLVGLVGEESFPEDELLPVDERCPTTLGELADNSFS
ncbi:MAG: hypothetical protein SCH68_11770 [Brevefilum sp.]|nr:hypothetical protein [Brevefilum sp.]